MEAELDTTLISFDKETGIGYITLNRPDSLNALNTQLREDIITSLQRLEVQNEDSDEIKLRAVIIRGAGDNFCAGADIYEFGDHPSYKNSQRNHFDFILDFPVPIIAKINGYCLGGGLETAMSCDFRIAHENSHFGLPEVDLGIIPGAGGIQFISRLANPMAAKEIVMTGEHISARRAQDLGIVNSVYDDDEFDDAVETFAETLASKPPLAIQAIKESANTAVETGLREGRKYDRSQAEQLFNTEDHREGIKAFADEDYDPVFKGQ